MTQRTQRITELHKDIYITPLRFFCGVFERLYQRKPQSSQTINYRFISGIYVAFVCVPLWLLCALCEMDLSSDPQ